MTFFLWIPASFARWIRLKIYQYEVTFAVYMLTPTEKFIFSMPTREKKAIGERKNHVNRLNRFPPSYSDFNDHHRDLCLPPRPHQIHLRPPLLLLGWRTSLHILRLARDQLGIPRGRHSDTRGHVRDSKK